MKQYEGQDPRCSGVSPVVGVPAEDPLARVSNVHPTTMSTWLAAKMLALSASVGLIYELRDPWPVPAMESQVFG